MSTSRRIPVLAGHERPVNLAVLMREAFVAINDLVIARLAERGHGDVRPLTRRCSSTWTTPEPR